MKNYFQPSSPLPHHPALCNHSAFPLARRALLTGAALALFSVITPANAADSDDWTGFHIGGNIGYGWFDSDVKTAFLPGTFASSYSLPNKSLDVDGPLAGVQLGYDWQFGQNRDYVLGVEVDFNWSDMHDSRSGGPLAFGDGTFPAADDGSRYSVSTDIDWLSTARLRAGFLPKPNWLIYATGGLAVGEVKNKAMARLGGGNAAIYANSSSETRTGWTLGAGTEWKFASQWSAKLEYLYFDLGDDKLTANRVNSPAGGDPDPDRRVRTRYDLDGHILRVGVNYHF
ncbi:MAG: porin family protein [Methylobacillus sp.]|jgi:outer membrane immunogenic protein|nr:porin family protein [Methylobacillus sp.]